MKSLSAKLSRRASWNFARVYRFIVNALETTCEFFFKGFLLKTNEEI